MMETSKNKNIAEKKVTELKQMKQELSENIASLNTEKGQEESIRDKFGFAKEGEEVVVIVEEKNEKEESEEDEEDGKFMHFLKNWFK
jgi:cell division protein FtsB